MARTSRITGYLQDATGMESHDDVAQEDLVVTVEDINEVEVNTTIPAVTPVSDHEVIEAEDTIDEVTQDMREDMDVVAQAEEARELARTELVTVENFIELLSFGIENSDYQPQFMAQASHYLQGWQGEEGIPAVNLESYGPESHALFYQNSLEAFEGLRKKLESVKDTTINKFRQIIGTQAKNEKYAKAAKANLQRADELLEKLGKKDMEGSVTITPSRSLARDLAQGGTQAKNLSNAIASDQRVVKYMGTTYLKTCESYSNAMMRSLKELPKGDVDTTVNNTIKAQTPGEQLPKNITDNGLLLANARVINPDLPSDLAARAKVLGTAASRPKLEANGGAVAPVEITLSRADIEKLLKSVKVYSSLMDEISKYAVNSLNPLGENEINNLIAWSKDNIDFVKSQKIQGSEHFRAYAEAITSSVDYIMALLPATYSHITTVSEALLALARQAIAK